jgi:hypothetical protein
MAVGDGTGQTYQGEQGIELATVLDSNFTKDIISLAAQRKAAKDKNRAAGAKTTREETPGETWHFYQNQLAKDVERTLNNGAAIMTATGSDNLWTDSNEYAANWRNSMGRLNKVKSNIDQYQDQYSKAIASIAVREDEYDPDYVNAVKAFPHSFSYEDLAEGNIQFPVPKFNNPGDLFSDLYVAEAERYFEQLGEGEPPNEQEVRQLLFTYFSDPSKEANAQAAIQMYERLDTDGKSYFKDLARRKGLGEPWMAYAMHNFMNMGRTDTIDLTSVAVKAAKDAPLRSKRSEVEGTAGITIGSRQDRFAASDYPEQAAKSYFAKNDYLLDKPEELRQLGIDMESMPDRENRRRAAEAALAGLIRENEPKLTDYTRDVEAGRSGISDEQKMLNFNDWRERLGSEQLVVADEAAKFLVDVSGFEGQAPISNARVVDSKYGLRQLVLEFNDQDQADRIRAKFLQEGFDPSKIELSEEENLQLQVENQGKPSTEIQAAKQRMLAEKRENYQKYIDELERQSTGNTVRIPFADMPGSYEQVLKILHNLSAEQKGELYQTALREEQPFEPTPPEEQSEGPLNLFD